MDSRTPSDAESLESLPGSDQRNASRDSLVRYGELEALPRDENGLVTPIKLLGINDSRENEQAVGGDGAVRSSGLKSKVKSTMSLLRETAVTMTKGNERGNGSVFVDNLNRKLSNSDGNIGLHAAGEWEPKSQISSAFGDTPDVGKPMPPVLLGAVDNRGDYVHYNPGNEVFSRKVFVGGLPIDINERVLIEEFGRYGDVVVDWPHKNHVNGRHPPRGYVFLVYNLEESVQKLVEDCTQDGDRYYLLISSQTISHKPVQIRPWRLADADFVLNTGMVLDPRKTVFIGGVPRPLKAAELAETMNQWFGNVCYAGIDTDPELKYPKGAGRVAFATNQSYIAAISLKYVHLQRQSGIAGKSFLFEGEERCTVDDKRVEVKPYVLDDQLCDECSGGRCGGRYAQLFCPHVHCLQYYCQTCWNMMHSRNHRVMHKPLVKENVERRRRSSLSFQVGGGSQQFNSYPSVNFALPASNSQMVSLNSHHHQSHSLLSPNPHHFQQPVSPYLPVVSSNQ